MYGSVRGAVSNDRPYRDRNSRVRPLFDAMEVWLRATLSRLPRKSDVASAMAYAQGRWCALARYCDDGRVEIDNNAAERTLRAVALGRDYAQSAIMCICT